MPKLWTRNKVPQNPPGTKQRRKQQRAAAATVRGISSNVPPRDHNSPPDSGRTLLGDAYYAQRSQSKEEIRVECMLSATEYRERAFYYDNTEELEEEEAVAYLEGMRAKDPRRVVSDPSHTAIFRMTYTQSPDYLEVHPDPKEGKKAKTDEDNGPDQSGDQGGGDNGKTDGGGDTPAPDTVEDTEASDTVAADHDEAEAPDSTKKEDESPDSPTPSSPDGAKVGSPPANHESTATPSKKKKNKNKKKKKNTSPTATPTALSSTPATKPAPTSSAIEETTNRDFLLTRKEVDGVIEVKTKQVGETEDLSRSTRVEGCEETPGENGSSIEPKEGLAKQEEDHTLTCKRFNPFSRRTAAWAAKFKQLLKYTGLRIVGDRKTPDEDFYLTYDTAPGRAKKAAEDYFFATLEQQGIRPVRIENKIFLTTEALVDATGAIIGTVLTIPLSDVDPLPDQQTEKPEKTKKHRLNLEPETRRKFEELLAQAEADLLKLELKDDELAEGITWSKAQYAAADIRVREGIPKEINAIIMSKTPQVSKTSQLLEKGRESETMTACMEIYQNTIRDINEERALHKQQIVAVRKKIEKYSDALARDDGPSAGRRVTDEERKKMEESLEKTKAMIKTQMNLISKDEAELEGTRKIYKTELDMLVQLNKESGAQIRREIVKSNVQKLSLQITVREDAVAEMKKDYTRLKEEETRLELELARARVGKRESGDGKTSHPKEPEENPKKSRNDKKAEGDSQLNGNEEIPQERLNSPTRTSQIYRGRLREVEKEMWINKANLRDLEKIHEDHDKQIREGEEVINEKRLELIEATAKKLSEGSKRKIQLIRNKTMETRLNVTRIQMEDKENAEKIKQLKWKITAAEKILAEGVESSVGGTAMEKNGEETKSEHSSEKPAAPNTFTEGEPGPSAFKMQQQGVMKSKLKKLEEDLRKIEDAAKKYPDRAIHCEQHIMEERENIERWKKEFEKDGIVPVELLTTAVEVPKAASNDDHEEVKCKESKPLRLPTTSVKKTPMERKQALKRKPGSSKTAAADASKTALKEIREIGSKYEAMKGKEAALKNQSQALDKEMERLKTRLAELRVELTVEDEAATGDGAFGEQFDDEGNTNEDIYSSTTLSDPNLPESDPPSPKAEPTEGEEMSIAAGIPSSVAFTKADDSGSCTPKTPPEQEFLDYVTMRSREASVEPEAGPTAGNISLSPGQLNHDFWLQKLRERRPRLGPQTGRKGTDVPEGLSWEQSKNVVPLDPHPTKDPYVEAIMLDEERAGEKWLLIKWQGYPSLKAWTWEKKEYIEAPRAWSKYETDRKRGQGEDNNDDANEGDDAAKDP